jgi:methyl-accepting chemotaxis protein
MSWMRNFPVARKFALAFGVVCVLCICLGIYAVATFHHLSTISVDVSENSFPSTIYLAEIRGAINSYRRADLDLLLCQDKTCADKDKNKREKARGDYENNRKLYELLVSYPGERELYSRIASNFDQYIQISDRSFALHQDEKIGEAVDLILADDTQAKVNASLSTASEDLTLKAKAGIKTALEVSNSSSRATIVMITVTVLIVLLCAVVGIMLNTLIAPPIERVTEALERVAQKDLTIHVEVLSEDEIGRLSAALNASVQAMHSVLGSMSQGAETLSAAASELSVRSVQTTGNTQIQTDKTSQIAVAAQQMTSTIAEISHNAELASSASQKSAKTASEGGAVMSSAAASMERIAAASGSVAE